MSKNVYSKKDFWLSVLSGLITGTIAWRILEFLSGSNFWSFKFWWLVFVIPVLWVGGVRFGFFLGRWFSFMRQFGKFAAIGFTNFTVDIGVLNILIARSGHAEGVWYAVFKSIAFFIAVIHSFFWNKYWTFEAGQSSGGGTEFGKFIAINLLAAGINVSIATFVATGIDPLSGFSQKEWATIAATIGSAIALIFSFVGLRLLVFKKSQGSVQ